MKYEEFKKEMAVRVPDPTDMVPRSAKLIANAGDIALLLFITIFVEPFSLPWFILIGWVFLASLGNSYLAAASMHAGIRWAQTVLEEGYRIKFGETIEKGGEYDKPRKI